MGKIGKEPIKNMAKQIICYRLLLDGSYSHVYCQRWNIMGIYNIGISVHIFQQRRYLDKIRKVGGSMES